MKLAVSILLIASIGCAHKPVKSKVLIVIPHECVTSDIVCTPGKKEMRCNFDKFTGCEVVKVPKDASK